MINNFLYYFIFTSSVLVYGIGLNRATIACEKPQHIGLNAIKMLITVSSSAILVYIVNIYILIPAHLSEIYPFFAVLIFSTIAVFVESIIRITARLNATEFSVSVLCVLEGVNESTSMGECVFNSCLCVLSFFVIIPVLYSIRKRNEISRPADDFEGFSLLLISVAILMIILCFWNVSWLNKGVLQ